jgi:RNA-directed DNA polymerase
MDRTTEQRPASVLLAQQAGAAASLWKCAKPCVWTLRMLTALIEGVEGFCSRGDRCQKVQSLLPRSLNVHRSTSEWFRLIDKVFSERDLLAAYQQVASKNGAAGVNHVSVDEFGRRLPENLRHLSSALRSGTFRPQAIRRVHIPKPGTNETRPLGIPTVRDRVVQAAIVNVIEPIFERDFAECSNGFRPGRSCRDALRRVDSLLQAGYVHVVDAHLKGCFDSIPHAAVMDCLKTKIADGRVLSMMNRFCRRSSWTAQKRGRRTPLLRRRPF